MRALTSSLSGVSGRVMSSLSTGTSGAYLLASLPSLGPLVWIKPTPLSVKSETLMTRAHGAGLQAGRDMFAVLLMLVASRLVLRVGDRPDQFSHTVSELCGDHRERLPLAIAWGRGLRRDLRPRRAAEPRTPRRHPGRG